MTNYTIMQANDTDSTALKFKARKTDKLEIQLPAHTFPNRFPCTYLQQWIRRNKPEIPMQFQGKWSMKESS